MKAKEFPTDEEKDVDVLTNSTLAHPAGVGMGAAGGALAGAAAGSIAGPVGTAIGALVGAVAGGATGHAVAATISPTEEELYWSENHPSQTYAEGNDDFEDFRPAYRMGVKGPARYPDGFEAAEASLERDWKRNPEGSTLEWTRAKPAVRAAWERVATRGPRLTSSQISNR
ncbi:hypothetical protein OKA05_28485 [Luteolibacter arcticus]|uniref:Glycine zipper domain-containing protein n=1 Tax=Luteolibacter arcticus TaxID=1581411 RepID=A0ABT3GSS5_9BACT|nr:hypothetical protein [Luteolibacter arcticus]MCW1926523.1 hypothetical protein [Luteolibacter arcticus]